MDVGILLGKTLTRVENIDDYEIIFTTDNGEVYKLYHEDDCCESVMVDDICGDLPDLVGSPLVEAEESIGDFKYTDRYFDSVTWTFYRFRTAKGSVVIRWCGESNGYYSESVDFCKVS